MDDEDMNHDSGEPQAEAERAHTPTAAKVSAHAPLQPRSPRAQRWHGAKDLLADGVEQGSRAVERSQRSLTRRIFSSLDTLTGRRDVLSPLEDVLQLGFAASHINVRLVSRLASLALGAAVDVADTSERLRGATMDSATVDSAMNSESPVALRSDVIGTQPWLWDGFIGVVNGVVGDHLAASNNPLAMPMQLRFRGSYGAPEDIAAQLLSSAVASSAGGAAPPLKRQRVAVFVHGLTATEWSWALDAANQHGSPSATFATMLHADLGIEPVFVRYNSGRHISENGQDLSASLQRLVSAVTPESLELILVGHSMGGLVTHSAVHAATHDQPATWPSAVSHVITLGTPHEGAPLEKFGQLAERVLGAIDLPATRIPAEVIGARSAGIKDLRYGHLVAADWQATARGHAHPRTPLQRIAGAQYHRVVGTLTADPNHPVGQVVGDALVRPDSAAATGLVAEAPGEVERLGDVSHIALTNHARVYALLRAWLTPTTDER